MGGLRPAVGFARGIEGQQQGRRLMFAVIVLLLIVAVLGCRIGTSFVAGAGAGS